MSDRVLIELPEPIRVGESLKIYCRYHGENRFDMRVCDISTGQVVRVDPAEIAALTDGLRAMAGELRQLPARREAELARRKEERALARRGGKPALLDLLPGEGETQNRSTIVCGGSGDVFDLGSVSTLAPAQSPRHGAGIGQETNPGGVQK